MWSPLTPLPRRHQGPYVWLWNDVCAHYFLLSLLVPYLDKCIALNLSLCPQVPCCPFPSQNDPPPQHTQDVILSLFKSQTFHGFSPIKGESLTSLPLQGLSLSCWLAPIPETFCLPLHAREVVSNEIFPEASTDLPLGSRALTPACNAGSWLYVLVPPFLCRGLPNKAPGS